VRSDPECRCMTEYGTARQISRSQGRKTSRYCRAERMADASHWVRTERPAAHTPKGFTVPPASGGMRAHCASRISRKSAVASCRKRPSATGSS